MDFAVLADHRIKLKKEKRRISTSTLLGNLKKSVEHESDDYTNYNWCSWYSQKGLKQVLEGLEITRGGESIQTTALLRSDKILKRVRETCGHSNSTERPSTNADVKNPHRVTIMIIIVEIGQNTKKTPGDSRKLPVAQTPMENQQLTLV